MIPIDRLKRQNDNSCINTRQNEHLLRQTYPEIWALELALYVSRVVNSLRVLKGRPECLKCGKPFVGICLWELTCSPDHLVVPAPSPRPHPSLGPGLRASLLASPNSFTKIRLCRA